MTEKIVEITVKDEYKEFYTPDVYHHICGTVEEGDETETHILIRPIFWTKENGRLYGSLTRFVKDHVIINEFRSTDLFKQRIPYGD